MRVGVVIAAAGQSKRFGFPKALMPIGQNSALQFLANRMRAIKPCRIIATLPPSLLINPGFSDPAGILCLINNDFPKLGYMGSIKSALAYLDTTLDGIFVTPVDAPYVPESMLIAMVNVARHAKDAPLILVPYHWKNAGHPVFLSQHFFKRLLATKILSLRDFIKSNQDYASGLYWPDHRLLLNINTPSDLELNRRHLEF
jgi:CTP:molybdopterin cytidylyltransferase MocA